MKRTIIILLLTTIFAARLAGSDDSVVVQRQRAEAAALVILVQTEPVGEQTRLKIVEFWKRKASDIDLSRYFADGYLPFRYPSSLVAGQQIVAYYFLPSSGWSDYSNLQLGSVLVDGKFTFDDRHKSKLKQEFSLTEFKRLLSNDKEPIVLPPPFCPIK